MPNDGMMTPPNVVEIARWVMGGIDLDPASNHVANKTVRADRYYTKEENGLILPWSGRVWLNPPYSKGNMQPFSERFVSHTGQGILISNAKTAAGWFQFLMRNAKYLCLPDRRMSFIDPATMKPKHGNEYSQAIWGNNHVSSRFIDGFCKMGPVFYLSSMFPGGTK